MISNTLLYKHNNYYDTCLLLQLVLRTTITAPSVIKFPLTYLGKFMKKFRVRKENKKNSVNLENMLISQ